MCGMEFIMNTIIEMLNTVNFLTVNVNADTIRVTVEDFAGFDDDFSEIIVDYDYDILTNIMEKLENMAISCDRFAFYPEFIFDNFKIIFSWASYDI